MALLHAFDVERTNGAKGTLPHCTSKFPHGTKCGMELLIGGALKASCLMDTEFGMRPGRLPEAVHTPHLERWSFQRH